MINNKIKIKSFVKQECVKATVMHTACKAKYGCGIDKSKTTVSLCTSAPLFCLWGGVTVQSKQRPISHPIPWGFKPGVFNRTSSLQ